jgi:hypothetical protein
MKVEFHRADDEEKTTVATATWDGHDVTIQAPDDELRSSTAKAFRRTPVVVLEPSSRHLGTSGETVIHPGDLEWFTEVARTRVAAETGLRARFVPGVVENGYDPAANYREFRAQVERLVTGSTDPT